MKQNPTIVCVVFSKEEINQPNFLNNTIYNRCGTTDITKAKEMGFSEKEVSGFATRANKIRKKIIADGGYSNSCPLIVAKCIEDDKIYVIDGQGRIEALRGMVWTDSMNENGIPAIMFSQPLTMDEILTEIRACNNCGQNWLNRDKRHSDAKIEGGDCLEAYNLVEAYKAKFDGMCGNYVADLLFYGQKASHSRANSKTLGLNDFRPNYEIFTNAYLSLTSQCSFDRSNRDLKKKAHNTNFAIIIESLYSAYEREYRDDAETLKKVLEKINNKIIDQCSGLSDTNFLRYFNYEKDARYEFYTKIVSKIKFKFQKNDDIARSWLARFDEKRTNKVLAA